MKVLHLINGLHPGGKERRLVELLKYLSAHRAATVELALMSRDVRYPEVFELGIPMHYLVRRSRKDPRVFAELYRLCRRTRPDIIHAWDSMTAVYAAPVARVLGIRLLNGMVTNAPRRLTPLRSQWIRARLSFPLSSRIIGNSQAGLASYHAPRTRSVCIYNGFSEARLVGLPDPADVRKAFGITTRFVVGMTGEFVDKKDYPTFIRAAQQVLSRRQDVTFVAVGEGRTLERCKAMVAPQEGARIRFLGWQAPVEPAMSMCDVGVLATDADLHGEGIANAILEFMALGKPVVATDSGGTREIVQDGVTGYLVANKDVAGLARRIEELLGAPATACAMGARGKERVAAQFSLERMGAEYVALYKAVMQEGNG